MAGALLRDRIERAGLADRLVVSTAGTWAIYGQPATEHAQAVMAERNIDLSDHRSRELDVDEIAAADLIITMEPGHKTAVEASAPEGRGKTFLLSELVGMSYAIGDPIGRSIDEYRATAREIEDIIDRGWARLLELAGGASDVAPAR
jgi:protein-tyrosine-phosphatase